MEVIIQEDFDFVDFIYLEDNCIFRQNIFRDEMLWWNGKKWKTHTGSMLDEKIIAYNPENKDIVFETPNRYMYLRELYESPQIIASGYNISNAKFFDDECFFSYQQGTSIFLHDETINIRPNERVIHLGIHFYATDKIIYYGGHFFESNSYKIVFGETENILYFSLNGRIWKWKRFEEFPHVITEYDGDIISGHETVFYIKENTVITRIDVQYGNAIEFDLPSTSYPYSFSKNYILVTLEDKQIIYQISPLLLELFEIQKVYLDHKRNENKLKETEEIEKALEITILESQKQLRRQGCIFRESINIRFLDPENEFSKEE